MNNFLAIDTSTGACSIAIHWQGETYVHHEVLPKQHNAIILPTIQQLMSDADIKLAQLDALVCGNGPGSFVGVRIAAGIIQGMALGADLPVIGISSLQTLAQGIYKQFEETEVWVIQDARINQVYSQTFTLDSNNLVMQPYSKLYALHPEELHFTEKIEWVPAGSGWRTYKDEITLPLAQFASPEKVTWLPRADDMLALAQVAYDQGELLQPDQLEPTYVRGTNPWKKSQ